MSHDIVDIFTTFCFRYWAQSSKKPISQALWRSRPANLSRAQSHQFWLSVATAWMSAEAGVMFSNQLQDTDPSVAPPITWQQRRDSLTHLIRILFDQSRLSPLTRPMINFQTLPVGRERRPHILMRQLFAYFPVLFQKLDLSIGTDLADEMNPSCKERQLGRHGHHFAPLQFSPVDAGVRPPDTRSAQFGRLIIEPKLRLPCQL